MGKSEHVDAFAAGLSGLLMKVIVGVEGNREPVLRRVRLLHAPVMVSANSIWDKLRNRFRPTWTKLRGLAVHLDSGGFVAMKRYGGFRFSIAAYARLAADIRPEWWAAMDFCCEPEVAGAAGKVWDRVNASAAYFGACWQAASDLAAQPPMPVLQGWQARDYVRAFGEYHRNVSSILWPEVIGLGSMCRRRLHGPHGVLAIIEHLHAVLPPRFKFHLFGVKTAALAALRNHPRIASVDSMAWAVRAQKASARSRLPCNNEVRAEFMENWLRKQRALVRPRPEQLALL